MSHLRRTEIRRPEWRWVAALALALILVSSLPYLVAWVATPDGAHFTGFVSNPMDQHSYVAKMRQGWNGSWRYRLAYTPEDTDGAHVFLFYLFLGHVSRLTHIPLIWMVHGVRVAACAILIPLCYGFAAQVCDEVRQRRWATLLMGVSSGLGWLAVALGGMTPDLWVVEAITFYALLTMPHISLAMALMLSILVLLGKPDRGPGWPRVIGAGLASIALGIVQPFAVIPVYAALGVFCLLQAWRDRRIPWHRIWVTGLAGLVAVMYPAYGVLAVQADPVMRLWNAQNQTPSPPAWEWLAGFGIVSLLAIPGSIWAARRRSDGDLLSLAWVIATAVGVYAPLALQRRLIIGVHIPLCVLAALGWWQVVRPRLRGRVRNLAQHVVVGFSALTNLFLISVTILAALGGEAWFYLSDGEYRAFEWLREAVPADAVVLCAPQTGAFVPAWAGQRVVYGHPFETVNAAERERQVMDFWSGKMDEAERASFLHENGVSYVLLGPRERELGGGAVSGTIAFEADAVAVYRLGGQVTE
jgi:hypothetical protein